jgi:Rad3-related DNA helicase
MRVILAEGRYRNNYFEWSHLNNLKEDAIRDWRPCGYFHQLNTALAASHSILNYSMFFAIMNKKIPSRELLILDEAHM